MNKADTEKILRFYNRIDDDIKMCKNSIIEYEERYNIVGAIICDDMPKGSSMNDKVAKQAIRNAEADTKESIDFLYERIEELKRMRMEILKELTALQAIHKMVLTEYYIKGSNWKQIAEKAGYSVRQMQNYRAKALEVMTEKITRNIYLSHSEFVKKNVL